MVPEEFEKEMIRIREAFTDDIESLHLQQDALMAALLYSLGYEKGIEVYKNSPAWYS